MVLDSETKSIPDLADDAVVTVSDEGALVKVHHAQDVSLDGLADDEIVPLAAVLVRVYVNAPEPKTPGFTAQISVPSGTLTVGDADREDSIEIGPGLWHIMVVCAPWDCADEVEFWLRAA